MYGIFQDVHIYLSSMLKLDGGWVVGPNVVRFVESAQNNGCSLTKIYYIAHKHLKLACLTPLGILLKSASNSNCQGPHLHTANIS